MGRVFWIAVDLFSDFMGKALTPLMNKLFPQTEREWNNRKSG